MKKIRVVIWCGKAANQRALAHKIAKQFQVVGIVVDTGQARKKKKSVSEIISLAYERFRFQYIYRSWRNLQQYYDEKFPSWPRTELLHANGINDVSTSSFTKDLKPDLIVVSGTGLVKEPLLSLQVAIGIVNLHTGLSPYVKGGPNCTNWCIANNDFHLIGNTIMWINGGIDSGNIITSETVDVLNAGSLKDVQLLVMEHAHGLYLKSIQYLESSFPPYSSVQQNLLGEGNLYLTKMWGISQKTMLLKNWRNRKELTTMADRPQTVDLRY